jgi:hypothetical protein
VSGAIVGGLVALTMFALGGWGLRSGADLVPATYPSERREREQRAIRRGARSLVVLGALFAVLAVLSLVAGLADHPTP